MRQSYLKWTAFFGTLAAVAACQRYPFAFQPDAINRGTTLDFNVMTPSEADILFIIDNSNSMLSKQRALSNSIDQLLLSLAPQDTSYRIGIVSTDAHGFTSDCNGNTNPPVCSNVISAVENGAMGNCSDANVAVARPHDGTLGRLIAAYDPAVFDPSSSYIAALAPDPNLVACAGEPNCPCPQGLATPSSKSCPNPQTAIRLLLPVNANSPSWPSGALCDTENENPNLIGAAIVLVGNQNIVFPYGFNCQAGPRTIIDHDNISLEACAACNCTSCGSADTLDTGSACYAQCIAPVTQAMVQSYFLSNVAGLGIAGFGWEEGLKSALYAIGVDPGNVNDTVALSPPYNLLSGICVSDPNQLPPNSYISTAGGPVGSWLRSDALLAMLFVSDEQDCSMPLDLMEVRNEYEGDAEPSQPVGSICYQGIAQQSFFDTTRLASLVGQRKGGSQDKVAIGFIGGAVPSGPAGSVDRSATPSDCYFSDVTDGAAVPPTQCSCFANPEGASQGILSPGWCHYSTIEEPSTGILPACVGLSGSRYVAFANNFSRHTFESICRNDPNNYGAALQDFAHIATSACFELQPGVTPYNNDPSNITVKRGAKPALATEAAPVPSLLSQTSPGSAAPGWYYDATDNKICLTGIERIPGDTYSIFVLENQYLNFNE